MAGLDVGQTAPLVRQRQQRLGEQRPGGHLEGDLPGAGLEDRAGDGDDVAQVEPLEAGKLFFAQRVLLGVDLQATGAVEEVGEDRLAHEPEADYAAGDGRWLRLLRLLGE